VHQNLGDLLRVDADVLAGPDMQLQLLAATEPGQERDRDQAARPPVQPGRVQSMPQAVSVMKRWKSASKLVWRACA